MADQDLEGALRALGRHLDVPPAPDVTAAVRTRLSRTPSHVPSSRRWQQWQRWRVPVLRYAVAILVLLLSLVVVTVPPVRAAVLEFFRIGGVELHQGEGPPAPGAPVPGTPVPGERRVPDLAEAARLTGLRVEVPRRFGAPNEIVVVEGRIVSLRWHDPVARFEAFDGRLAPLFQKYLRFETATMVDVGGVPGWFVPGPHELVYLDPDGRQVVESARLAASTLIWERDGVTYRLEASLPRDRLVAVAASVTGP